MFRLGDRWDSETSTRSSDEDGKSRSSPLSDCTIDTTESMSPLLKPSKRSSSPKLILNAEFIPIDYRAKKHNSSSRPYFENPRPAPAPPSRPLSFAHEYNKPPLPTPPADDDEDDDNPEDFLAFLSRVGFMAAEHRASSINRASLVSAGTSDSIHSRPTSTSTTDFSLRRPSNSFIVDSRRTSLALRRGSSGVIPPILQDDAFLPSKLELESPAMQREDNLSKMLSQMRMSSDFSFATTHPLTSTAAPPPAAGEDDLFLARKISSIDFTDLELSLARTRNPILTQLHKAYQTQFDIMGQQIKALKREIDAFKLQNTSPVQPYQRTISLDVASSVAPESVRASKSTQFSIQVPKRKSHQSVEQPFWKASLAEEDWDHGEPQGKRRGSIMRCISPMTMA
jgi:hypothetical protein